MRGSCNIELHIFGHFAAFWFRMWCFSMPLGVL